MGLSSRPGSLRIGTSGYQYEHWRGIFYPWEIPRREWLRYYARHFDTVEINNTFYQLPKAETFDAWREQAPERFCYALKLSRYVTHIRRLKEPRHSLAKFLRRAARLGARLGPILVQLPPRWGADPERLARFLEAAPRAHRWAIEFRDPDWLRDEVYGILARHGAALCVHDKIPDHPRPELTDWTYLRFHGDDYGGCYSDRELAAEARWIRGALARGLDVFAYFNNDAEGYAVRNAIDLRRYVTGR